MVFVVCNLFVLNFVCMLWLIVLMGVVFGVFVLMMLVGVGVIGVIVFLLLYLLFVMICIVGFDIVYVVLFMLVVGMGYWLFGLVDWLMLLLLLFGLLFGIVFGSLLLVCVFEWLLCNLFVVMFVVVGVWFVLV